MTPEETKIIDADVAAEVVAEEKVADDIKTVEAEAAPVVEEPVKVEVTDAVGTVTEFEAVETPTVEATEDATPTA